MDADFKLDRLPSPPRIPELLAHELRDKILTQQLPVGSALPTERELAELSGVSRSSVRDALRLLEAEGLVKTRTGRGGGTFVSRPDNTTVARSLEVFVLGRSVRLGALLEVRELLEPECAAMAALHRTEDDIRTLKELGAQLQVSVDDAARFLSLNVDWHVAVARASHNELIAAIMEGISRLVRAGTEAERVATPANFTHALTAHDEVVSAIHDQDPDRARAAMQTHVCGYADLLRDHIDAPVVTDRSSEEADE